MASVTIPSITFNQKQIAKLLRQRLSKLTLVSQYDLNRLSDQDVLESYVFCADCGRKIHTLRPSYPSVEYFVEKVSEDLRAHACSAKAARLGQIFFDRTRGQK